jgi:hypothetical protein
MKKHLLLLITVVLFSMASAFAQDCDYSGTTYNGLTWCLKSGTLTISGEGAIDYGSNGTPWYVYRESINSIVIHEGVTSTGAYAFEYCINLTSVTLPNSLTTIGLYAFQYCEKITSINIPNNLLYIGGGAFQCCTELTSIAIPNSVIQVYMPFVNNCKKLIAIDVESENNSYISENGVLFDKNKTKLICCPSGKIGEYVIPESVTTIGTGAFCTCRNLTSITIPKNVVSIESFMTFFLCEALTSITNLNPVPVNINSDMFVGTSISDCTLKVPMSSVTVYQNANVWQEFNIVGICSVNISVNNEEYGTVTGGGIYEENETATVMATANDGYKFANWTKNGVEVSTENPYSFTVTEDVELVANFEGYFVNISVNNEEYGAATGGGEYKANADATVTATAFTGYKFVNWTKNGVEVSTENPYTFTVTEDVELVANFEEEVGIENIEMATVKIYPNPTTGILRIENGELKIEDIAISDIFGKIQKIENWKTESTIDISHLPAGVYFVKISTEVGEVTRKVLKE